MKENGLFRLEKRRQRENLMNCQVCEGAIHDRSAFKSSVQVLSVLLASPSTKF